MSENELLDAFKSSQSFKDSKEIRKENKDDDEIKRDLKLVSAIFYQIFIFSPNDSP